MAKRWKALADGDDVAVAVVVVDGDVEAGVEAAVKLEYEFAEENSFVVVAAVVPIGKVAGVAVDEVEERYYFAAADFLRDVAVIGQPELQQRPVVILQAPSLMAALQTVEEKQPVQHSWK